MSEWTINGQQNIFHGNGDSIYFTNLDEWRHTETYPNNSSAYRPLTQQRATPISNFYHNHYGTNNQTIQESGTNPQLKRQQVSNQNQYLPGPIHQQAHHQNVQQHFHPRSSRILEHAPLLGREREYDHNINTTQSQLQLEVNASHPTPNTSSSIMSYNNSFQATAGTTACNKNAGKNFQIPDTTFYEGRAHAENYVLHTKAYITSLRKVAVEIQGEKEKLNWEKQALAIKVESLEVELSDLQNAFRERNSHFDDVYGEATQELKVTKEELERKITLLARVKLRAQKKDADLKQVLNKLKDVRAEMKKNRKTLRKLQESVIKRNAQIIELKREKNELQSNVEDYEKECEHLKEHVAKLECDMALEKERKEKLKDYYAKWFNREIKKQTKKIKSLEEERLAKANEKRSVESNSSEQQCNSNKIRKLGGRPSQVDQGPAGGGGGATSEKLQRVKKNEKWNLKNYIAKEKNNLWQYNKSSSIKGGVGLEEIEADAWQKETGENKNDDGHKKRVCSIAKTRLPQWKHLRPTSNGDSSLATARQDSKQFGSNFRKK